MHGEHEETPAGPAGKRQRPRDLDWAALREQHETSAITVAALARSWGIRSPNTIYRKIAQEGWTRRNGSDAHPPNLEDGDGGPRDHALCDTSPNLGRCHVAAGDTKGFQTMDTPADDDRLNFEPIDGATFAGRAPGAAVLPFTFEQTRVRVVRNGAPRWVLADACRVPNIANSRNVTARLDGDEITVHTMDTSRGPRHLTIVSESGLYEAIQTSRKPAAQRFRKWVRAEVLPAIRETGQYRMPAPAAPPPDLNDLLPRLIATNDALRATNDALLVTTQALLTSTTQLDALQAENAGPEARNAALAPQAAGLQRLADAHGSKSITDAAKSLGIPPGVLRRWMDGHDWTYRRFPNGPRVAFEDKLRGRPVEAPRTPYPDEGWQGTRRDLGPRHRQGAGAAARDLQPGRAGAGAAPGSGLMQPAEPWLARAVCSLSTGLVT